MNLSKLFQTQKALDDRIVAKHNLQNEDLLPKKILALQVELGELANEVRVWKFWSEDQKPRLKVPKQPTMNYDDIEWHNPVLEEYVDCLHFILTIGLEKDFVIDEILPLKAANALRYFNYLFRRIAEFSLEQNQAEYELIFDGFIGLGEMLGFTQAEIEQAYFDKNKINHTRQDNHY